MRIIINTGLCLWLACIGKSTAVTFVEQAEQLHKAGEEQLALRFLEKSIIANPQQLAPVARNLQQAAQARICLWRLQSQQSAITEDFEGTIQACETYVDTNALNPHDQFYVWFNLGQRLLQNQQVTLAFAYLHRASVLQDAADIEATVRTQLQQQMLQLLTQIGDSKYILEYHTPPAQAFAYEQQLQVLAHLQKKRYTQAALMLQQLEQQAASHGIVDTTLAYNAWLLQLFQKNVVAFTQHELENLTKYVKKHDDVHHFNNILRVDAKYLERDPSSAKLNELYGDLYSKSSADEHRQQARQYYLAAIAEGGDIQNLQRKLLQLGG
jgi:hypothetical protein